MRREPNWLSAKTLLLLHEESIATFGGARGVRDHGLLESALARPQNMQAYRPTCSLADLASCYAYGLARNHPFVDGNKRAAFLAIGVFLAINDRQLNADQLDAIRVIESLASGDLEEPALSAWITRNTERRNKR
ncbi:MAG: type II toxin-antitoxin system death-on-curing family toxin [Acidobacteria bacterium]|nr:MAG: type II toxin-antitoxin system death-on-curing family toxin [Acidobacteriota bacterium]